MLQDDPEDLEALGLANRRLSFLGSEATELPKSARMKVTAGPVVPGQSGRMLAPGMSGKLKGPAASGKFAVPTGEIWYVSQARLEGKRRVKKMTAGQIIEQLQHQQLKSETEISREANSGYAPAHTIPEFAAYCSRATPKPAPPAPRATLTAHRQPTQISHWDEPQPSFSRLYGGLVIGGVLALLMLIIFMIVFIK